MTNIMIHFALIIIQEFESVVMLQVLYTECFYC